MARSENHGWIKFRNETLEGLCSSGLRASEIACYLLIYRKTIGWKKFEDEISLSQFMDCLPYSKPSIVKALKVLQLVNLTKLVKSGKSLKQSNLWRIVENPNEWKLVNLTKLVKNRKRTSKNLHHKLVNLTQHTKDNTKETIQKKGEQSSLTPKEKNEFFFRDDGLQKKARDWAVKNGASAEEAETEIHAFIAYWTEPNSTGKKMRWQMQSTFDVRRRLANWLRNSQKFSGEKPFEPITDSMKKRMAV